MTPTATATAPATAPLSTDLSGLGPALLVAAAAGGVILLMDGKTGWGLAVLGAGAAVVIGTLNKLGSVG